MAEKGRPPDGGFGGPAFYDGASAYDPAMAQYHTVPQAAFAPYPGYDHHTSGGYNLPAPVAPHLQPDSPLVGASWLERGVGPLDDLPRTIPLPLNMPPHEEMLNAITRRSVESAPARFESGAGASSRGGGKGGYEPAPGDWRCPDEAYAPFACHRLRFRHRSRLISPQSVGTL